MKPHLFAAIVLVLALAQGAAVAAQDATPPDPNFGQRGGWGGGMGMGGARGILGTVTEVTAEHYTVKTEAGEVYTVHYSVNTRILKAPQRPAQRGSEPDRQQNPPQAIKPSEIKVGDVITAGGEVDAAARSVGAVFILQIDPERAKQLAAMQANFGKTWLMGKVTAIDGVKVTVQGGPDGALHSFTADENTTFRKRREPITLADVEVGDGVRVEGAVKDGGFLATAVVVMGPPPGGPGAEPASPQPK